MKEYKKQIDKINKALEGLSQQEAYDLICYLKKKIEYIYPTIIRKMSLEGSKQEYMITVTSEKLDAKEDISEDIKKELYEIADELPAMISVERVD